MVSIKHKVTLKTKVAQEETPEAIESPKVTLKRKHPEAPVVAKSKPAHAPTQPIAEPKQEQKQKAKNDKAHAKNTKSKLSEKEKAAKELAENYQKSQNAVD